MTFNIGSQSGGVVNNVAGNQRVEGGQHGVQVSREDAASAAATLRELLARADLSTLSDEDRAIVHEDAAAISDEMASPEPAPIGTCGRCANRSRLRRRSLSTSPRLRVAGRTS